MGLITTTKIPIVKITMNKSKKYRNKRSNNDQPITTTDNHHNPTMKTNHSYSQ